MAQDSVTALHVIPTQHEDMIHDSQFDYYGKLLATASSDRTVRVFDVAGETHSLQAEIRGHEGPVWEVAWSHPRFGNFLASCSYDNSVRVHHATEAKTPENMPIWESLTIHEAKSSVNSIAWAPYEHGAMIAAVSSDGELTVCWQAGGRWEKTSVQACDLGCTSVSWAPYSHLGFKEGSQIVKRIAVGCCDNKVRIFKCVGDSAKWEEDGTLGGAADWIRDVSWSPSSGMPANVIASASEDGKVTIWKQTEAKKEYTPSHKIECEGPAWRVSWSVTGAMLAVSSGDSKVALYKEEVDGKWKPLDSDASVEMN